MPKSKIRLAARLLSAVILALPLAGAECADLTQSTSSSASSYDGTYTLVEVDGSGLPADIIYVTANDRLELTRGEWTISNNGTSLTTRMWTTAWVGGDPTREARFNPEVHSCSVEISGDTAQCTLDSGSTIYASISGGTVVYSYSGHQLRFVK